MTRDVRDTIGPTGLLLLLAGLVFLALFLWRCPDWRSPAPIRKTPVPARETVLPVVELEVALDGPIQVLAASEAVPRPSGAPRAVDVESEALLLAHLYLMEAGPYRTGEGQTDIAIMANILNRRAGVLSGLLRRPVSLAEAADRYSGRRLRGQERPNSGRARYILDLRPGDGRPASFPDTLDWGRFEAGFMATLLLARDHVLGLLPPDPCNGRGAFWGGSRGLEMTTDRPRGSMQLIECEGDHLLRVYSSGQR